MSWASGTGTPCVPIGWERDSNGNLPAVHQHVGGLWWWIDETGTDEFGGFRTKEEAEKSLERYARKVLG